MNDESIDAVLGDLDEEYKSRLQSVGKLRAQIWYWKEAILMLAYAVRRHAALAVLAGIVTGIGALMISRASTHGPDAIYPYAVLVLSLIAYLRFVPTGILRMMTVFAGTLSALLTLFAGLIHFNTSNAEVPLWVYARSFGLILAIAAAISITVSYIAPGVSSHPYPYAIAMGFFGTGALWLTSHARQPILLPVVLTLLLLTTGVYLHRQRIERFEQRLIASAIVCTVMTGLTFLYLITLANPRSAGITAWKLLFQHGLLYVEIAVTSVLLALATRRNSRSLRA